MRITSSITILGRRKRGKGFSILIEESILLRGTIKSMGNGEMNEDVDRVQMKGWPEGRAKGSRMFVHLP